jgi:hypothetical protein
LYKIVRELHSQFPFFIKNRKGNEATSYVGTLGLKRGLHGPWRPNPAAILPFWPMESSNPFSKEKVKSKVKIKR